MTAAPGMAELFPHVRIVMGMVIGLGMTRLLMGFAGLVQHPDRARPSAIHLLWALSVLIAMVLFWWWEFALFAVETWTFGIFAFLIVYSTALFFLAALLFPDNVNEYGGYENFFLSRRRWFFSVFALTFVLDIFDAALTNSGTLVTPSVEALAPVPIGLALCAIAIWTANRRFHLALVVFQLLYQMVWIGLLFHTPQLAS
jgi:hypothetical protein